MWVNKLKGSLLKHRKMLKLLFKKTEFQMNRGKNGVIKTDTTLLQNKTLAL